MPIFGRRHSVPSATTMWPCNTKRNDLSQTIRRDCREYRPRRAHPDKRLQGMCGNRNAEKPNQPQPRHAMPCHASARPDEPSWSKTKRRQSMRRESTPFQAILRQSKQFKATLNRATPRHTTPEVRSPTQDNVSRFRYQWWRGTRRLASRRLPTRRWESWRERCDA
jgi:hypothetical protein